MNGTLLRFYVEEKQMLHGVLLWEWLLDSARKLGVQGGSAFRSIGGFGRHHNLHESRFFELAGNAGIEVEFIVGDEEARRLIALIGEQGVRVFYSTLPARFGVINPDPEDASGMFADPPVQ